MRKRRKYYDRLLLFLTSLLLVAAIFCGYTYLRIRPLILSVAEAQAQNICLDAANAAIVEILKDNSITYSSIARLSRDDTNKITGLEIDISQINLLKSLISAKLSHLISENSEYTVTIPAGTLTGNEFLTGVGPAFKFKMQTAARAVVDFESNFISEGINQTLHQILINIDLSGTIILIGSRSGFKTKTSAIAAQTVIVGVTPENFTNVIENPGSSVADNIFNYGQR